MYVLGGAGRTTVKKVLLKEDGVVRNENPGEGPVGHTGNDFEIRLTNR